MASRRVFTMASTLHGSGGVLRFDAPAKAPAPVLPSAVEEFASAQARGTLPSSGLYRHPLPMRAPRTGEQYAFAVDLDACTGCKACVTACHALNGLDPEEAWRNVTLLSGTSETAVVLQHVTASCHHCLQPACLEGCPANAYKKDTLTGIVRHLDDQCIGCRYCTFTCPYGAPQYVARLGIVRKCDMCAGRLNAGQAPACVQGCPNGAIRIELVERTEVEARARAESFLPHGAHPRLTEPTSRYAKRHWPEHLRLADPELLRPEEGHWPLAIMLVLTQLAVGAFFIGKLVQQAGTGIAVREGHAALSAATASLALGASLLHLGRPLLAWRAVLGLGHSWLSREVVAFGAFAALAAVAAAIEGGLLRGWGGALAGFVQTGAALAGGIGLVASAMVYRRTARPLWHGALWRFGLTTLLLGSAASAVSVLVHVPGSAAASERTVQGLAVAMIMLALVKLGLEARVFWWARKGLSSALGRAARLLTDVLYQWSVLRFACGWVGGVVVPLLLLVPVPPGSAQPFAAALVALLLLVSGELLERWLFFRAGVPATAVEVSA
ncbi:MAG: dimethyl sulfoxide reductase anchor subunit [Candidatus Binatia bacterium]|nr:dimethyl sulfoxide reductase anchor subunit [Candidatus Binatia bacterium]